MILFQAFYFALPIYLANMAPVLVKHLPILSCPLDSGVVFRGKRLFGQNKTWRGLISGIFMGILIVMLQAYLYVTTDFAQAVSLFDYTQIDAITLGTLMGGGALIGDALKSFFKRQVGREPGSSWVPFDQLDFIVMALLLTSIMVFPGWMVILVLLIITPVLHFATNYISFKIGLKEVPW